MKFTDNYLKGLKPSASASRVYEKGTDKGFGVKITPAGSRSFFVQYAADNKQRFFGLGNYPSVSLADAREKCRSTRILIDSGIDPQNVIVNTYGSVQELFDHYIESMKMAGKRTWHDVETTLLKNCADIVKLSAYEVTPTHIKNILHTVISRGSLVQSNRLRSHLLRAFKLGILHDNSPLHVGALIRFNIASNPVADVPNNPDAENVGERVLSFEELATLWNYKGSHLPYSVELALKMILSFGGMRTGEVTRAQIAEFDLDARVWSIPPERLKAGDKTGRWNLLPITDLSMELFLAQRQLSGGSPCLFPNRVDQERYQSDTALSHVVARFCAAEKFPVFKAKDLRRTVKTRMGELGIDKSIRDRIQNHALTDVSSKHYDRYDYLPEKREALEIWCNALSKL